MTLDQLRYFVEAAKFQHIGRAAQSIHISPSAISSAIGLIEEELGTMLFERQGKSIILNSQGRQLRDEAERILSEVKSLRARITGEAEELAGHYKLGGSPFLAANHLTEAWSELQKSYPKLVGDLTSLPTANVIANVIAGTLDFGLCFSPFSHPDLKLEEVYQGQMVLAVRKNHPVLKEKGKKACRKLSEYPAVIHKSHPGVEMCETHPMFSRFEISVRTAFYFDSDDCAVKKLSTSDAWTLLPNVVVEKYSTEIRAIVHPPEWSAPYSICAVMRKDRDKHEVLHRLVSGIRAIL